MFKILFQLIFPTLLSLFIFSCSQKEKAVEPSEEEILRNSFNRRIVNTYAETQGLDVFYATNRGGLGEGGGDCNDKSYGVNPGTNLRFGICRVNVPKKHPTGFIDASGDPRSDSHKYFRLLNHKGLTGDAFKQMILDKKPKSILVFVHGFNVKFDGAIMRTAQIAYDLKYQSPVISFTWPAGAQEGLMNSLISKTYENNKTSAEASVAIAADFFKSLADFNLPVHVIVHSMGHQVVIPAIDKVAQQLSKPIIDELILNAPDLNVEAFKNFLPSLKKVARRVTVYCSFNDNAIAASEVYNKNRRLGACETAEGIDVINVSEIDAPTMGVGGLGHGYYSSRPILTDVFQILLGIEAERRLFIRKSEPNSVENYFLRQ